MSAAGQSLAKVAESAMSIAVPLIVIVDRLHHSIGLPTSIFRREDRRMVFEGLTSLDLHRTDHHFHY